MRNEIGRVAMCVLFAFLSWVGFVYALAWILGLGMFGADHA